MDGGTRAIVYACVLLLVGYRDIQFGSSAPTLNNGEGIFSIRHASSGKCLWADLQGLQMLDCSGHSEEQWKWGSGHRLFHVTTARCLGLRVRDKALALLDCSQTDATLSWRCEDHALYVWSRKYLSVTGVKLGVRDVTQDGWVRDNSSESVCHRPYQVVFTRGGTSLGAPCEFPFRYNGIWYHGCVPDDSGYSWCSTTPDFDKDRQTGYCLRYQEGCEQFWVKSDSGYCYQHNKATAVTWHQARASCQSQGGDLLSVAGASEQVLISGADDPRQMWIGLNQLDMAQGWQWSDGSPLAYLNWNPGLANVSILRESDCAVITTEGYWEKTACGKKLPYICKKAWNQTVPEPTSPWTLKSAKCEAGWHQWNGFCYTLVREPTLPQQEAQQHCSNMQGALVSVHSLADLEAISDLHTDAGMEIWTGLRSETAPPLFQWTDESAVSFTHWARDEPRTLTPSKPTCVSYFGELFHWKVSSCDDELPFLCKKKGENAEAIIDEGCPTDGDWKRHGSACYKVDPGKVLFKNRCNLTITNRFEQAYINSLIRGQSETQYFWVGLQDANSTGEYRWSNGDGPKERLTFSNWAKGEPARPGQCAVMSSRKPLGQWQLQSCSQFTAGSVCKRAIGPHSTPDPEPDPSLPCAAGWESKQGLPYCYKVFQAERLSRQRSWEEAERFCQALDAHLPSFSNLDEMEAMHTILRGSISNDRYFWVGLNRRNPVSGNAWEWSDGRPVSSVILSEELQEDDEYNRDCVALKTMRRSYLSFILLLHGHSLQHFFATPFHCDAQLEWLCQIPRGKKPKTPEWYNPGGHHETSIFVDGNEFWFVSEPLLPFEEAGLYCSNNDSRLAALQTMKQVGAILTQLKQISERKQSWWVEAADPGQSFPMLFHPIRQYYSAMRGRCSSLDSDSPVPKRELNCEQRLPFVCEKVNITSVEKNPLEPRPGGLPCGSDSQPFRNKCYTVLKPEKMAFEKAIEHCQSLRGTLPVISSQAEQDFVLSLLPDHLPRKLWIGLRRRHNRPEWKWVDDSPLEVDNFNTLLHGQMRYLPINNFGTLDLCATLYNDASAEMMGTWDYTTCSDEQYAAVCEHYADKPESPKAPEGNFTVGNHTYRVLRGNMTWFAALESCKELDMDLASVLDGSQQAGLTVATSRAGGPLWIGLFSEDEGVHYRWTDHSHTLFSRWFPEPTSGRCVYLDTDGFWKATQCEEELEGAICHVPQAEKTLEDAAVKCPHRANGPGWTPFRNHCYAFRREASRWAAFEKGDSRETCKSLDPNAEVLTIRDEEENEFVRKQFLPLRDLATFVWIGIFKDNKTDQLKWYDGTNVQYSNWNDGRPNITDGFMAGLSASGSWKLFTTKHSFERIKQISVVACKIDYDPKADYSKYVGDFENYGSLRYKVLQKKLAWPQALRECGELGGHLASAHDLPQDAHLQLLSKIDGFPLWIGLSSQDQGSSSFEWSDGTNYDYMQLGFTSSGSRESCMLVNRTGAWVQADCASLQEGAICYLDSTQSPKASPQQSDGCPKTGGASKWIHYKDHCYAFDMALFNYSAYTMVDAKAICNNLDESSQLLTIKDEDENAFVSRYLMENPLITKRAWLGLGLNAQGDSEWIDGTSVGFSNWDKNAASLKGTEPICAVLISGGEGAWSRVSCTEIRSRVVCKAPAPRRGTPAALAFFIILVMAIIAAVLLIIWRRRRDRFSSTVRYQRNFDEPDSSNVLTEMESEFLRK